MFNVCGKKIYYKNQGLCVLSWSALSSNAPFFLENIETKGFTNLNSFFWKHIRGFDVQLHKKKSELKPKALIKTKD
jgi:hypothetical protein